MSSGGGSTQSTDPWSGQQPFLEDIYSQASTQFRDAPPEYYQGNTVAGFSDPTLQGLDLTQQRAGGSPYQDAFNSYLTGAMGQGNVDPMQVAAMNEQAASSLGGAQTAFGGTAAGEYLGSNPYLDAAYDTAAGKMTDTFNESVLPGISSQFGAAGRSGSGIQALTTGRAAGELTDSLGQLASGIYAPAYEAERDRQMQAASGLANIGMGGVGGMGDLYGNIGEQQFRAGSLAPSAQAMDYTDIDRLMQSGAITEDQAQRLIDADVNRWNYNQNIDHQQLQNYANLIYGSPTFSSTTTSSSGGGGRVQGALGGAAAGSALGAWGAAGGALLGGLLAP